MDKLRTRLRLVLLALACAALNVAVPSVARASVTVTGAGSTWVQIALDQWRADVAQRGLSINYQGVGSSAGRQFFIINQVDFAASEIPFQPDEVQTLESKGMSYQYVPDVAGGTSFMYNLKDGSGNRVTNLRLSATTIAKIFTGQITNWDDPAITADNGGVAFPSQTLTPVIRSDGSGTSAQLSLYLAHEAPAVWNDFLAAHPGLTTPVSEWPPFDGSVAQRGSDGVANFVANDAIGQGSINYVEYGYATQRGFPAAYVHNVSGNYVLPTSNNVATALTHATLNTDLTQNLGAVYTAPEANAYPVSSYSYLITRTTGFDPDKGNVLGQWMIYIACDGQQESAVLGYSPLPPNLVQDVFDAVGRIPGAPAPPAMSDCNNPTIPHGGSPSPTPMSTGSPTPGGGGSTPPPGGGGSTPPPGGGGSTPPPGSGGSTGPTGSLGGSVSQPGATPTTSGGLGAGLGGGTSDLGSSGTLAESGSGLSSGDAPAAVPPGESLSDPQVEERMQGALAVVGAVTPAATTPIGIAVLGLVLVVFTPALVRRRRSRVRSR
jgi:phosphate ABC transporter phosphate-binding protein